MQAEAQWYLSTSRLLSHAPSMKTHEKALLILISNLSNSLWDLTDLELRFLVWDDTARSPEGILGSPNTQNAAITLGYLTSECLKLMEHERGLDLNCRGAVHDTLQMFHHWQPDLPAHLQFAASFVRFPFPRGSTLTATRPAALSRQTLAISTTIVRQQRNDVRSVWAIRPANLFTFQTNSRRVGYEILCDEPERTGHMAGRSSFFCSAHAQTFAVAGSAGFFARTRALSRHAARCVSQ